MVRQGFAKNIDDAFDTYLGKDKPAFVTNHSYERSLVNLYNSVSDEEKKLMAFNRAKYYKEEFVNYQDGDSEGYYWQTVELDARDYSEEAAEDYKNKILNHLEYS